jgi:hypothetical protein
LLFQKLVKYGGDVKGKLYKHLMHGYLQMDGYPFQLEESNQTFEEFIESIKELAGSQTSSSVFSN